MAKIPLTQENLNTLYKAIDTYFPKNGYFDGEFSYGGLSWDGLPEFLEDLSDTTGLNLEVDPNKPIASLAKAALEKNFEIEQAAAKEKTEGNMSPDREQLEAERAKREAAIKETEEKAREQVAAEQAKKAAYIKQKQVIQDQYQKARAARAEVQNKKIYVKIVEPTAPTISTEERIGYEKLKDLAIKDPRVLQQELSKAIQDKIPPVVKASSSPQETALYADSVAADTVSSLARGTPVTTDIETAILVSVSANNKVFENISSQPEIQNLLGQGTNDLARLKMSTYIAKSSALDLVVGQNVRQLIIGGNPADVQVLFMDSTDGATHTLDLGKLNDNYQTILQNPVFTATEDTIKGKVFSYGKQQLLTKINSLSPESYLGKTVATQEFQSALLALQPYTSFEFVGAQGLPGMFGKFIFQFSPESAPLVSAFGNMVGIDFGIAPITVTAAPVAVEAIGEGLVATTTAIGGEAIATGAATAVGTEVAATATGVAVGAEVAAGGAAAGATAGAAAGTAIPVPVVGTIIGAVVGFVLGVVGPGVLSWVTDKYNKNKEMIVAAPVAIATWIFAGPIAGITAGVGTFGLLTAAGGGFSALGSAIGSGMSKVFGFFASIWNTFLAAIGAPIAGFMIGFPIFIIFVLIIINNSAYLTPPGSPALSSTNPYIQVDKVASPTGQLPSPTTITYTVTITAKTDTLSGVSFKTTCSAIKKSGSNIDCKNLEQIPAAPASISPGSPFTFTFTSNYDSKYADALVTDTITVSASSNAGGKVSETGTASICFGDCPLNCFKTVDSNEPWPANFKANLDAAAATLGGTYPNFAAKACAGGTVNLCYTTKNPSPIGKGLCNQTIYARHAHAGSCDINFNQCGIKSQSDALFILTHEATHHIQNISGGYERQFEQQVPKSEWPMCTYSATGDPYESMAEGDALFVGKPSWSSCVTNYQSQYPKHYLFAKNVMFAP